MKVLESIMKINFILKLLSALILLYCTFTMLVMLLGLFIYGMPSSTPLLFMSGLVLMTGAVCFVASYRQILQQRPGLIMSALGLLIAVEIFAYFLMTVISNDPMASEVAKINEAIKESIKQGLEDGTLPSGKGLEDQLEPLNISWKSTSKSILLYVALFVIPIYTNFRKLKNP